MSIFSTIINININIIVIIIIIIGIINIINNIVITLAQ